MSIKLVATGSKNNQIRPFGENFVPTPIVGRNFMTGLRMHKQRHTRRRRV